MSTTKKLLLKGPHFSIWNQPQQVLHEIIWWGIPTPKLMPFSPDFTTGIHIFPLQFSKPSWFCRSSSKPVMRAKFYCNCSWKMSQSFRIGTFGCPSAALGLCRKKLGKKSMWSVMIECGSSIKTKKTWSTALVLLKFFFNPYFCLWPRGQLKLIQVYMLQEFM